MSTTIHFVSGKTREIDTNKLDKFIIDLKGRGMSLMINRDEEHTLIIPLNSNTMEFIEDIHEPVEESESPIDESDEELPSLEDMKKDLEDAVKDMEKKKDPEEKQEDAMKELLAKSNCKHPENLMKIYKQVTSKGSRYFPICTFCGKRERYVKADSLSDEVKEAAPIWED